MKSFKITAVRSILTAKDVRPMIIFDVVGQEKGIVRIPKMALIDLHNSGRALNIPERAFDGDVKSWNMLYKSIFLNELRKCVGAVITGDIVPVKKGDTYIVDANSTAFKNKTAKIGEKAVVKQDGMRVTGFLTIPFSEQHEQRIANAEAYALVQMSFFGADDAFGSSNDFGSNNGAKDYDGFGDETEDIEDETPMNEATGKAKK